MPPASTPTDVPYHTHICKPQDARKRHRFQKAFGEHFESPKKKRAPRRYKTTVDDPLISLRRRHLREKMARLQQPQIHQAIETPAAGPIDVVEVEMEQDFEDIDDDEGVCEGREGVGNGSTATKDKRDTKGEAQNLYNKWKKLVPDLVHPLLKYINHSTGHPTSNEFDATPCDLCDPSTHSTTRMILLFWDRKWFNSVVSPTDNRFQ